MTGKLRIKDAPQLPNILGTEKIPTGGRGNFSASIDQIKEYTLATFTDVLDSKVDKVNGKELSDNNFTDELLDKLNSVQEGAEQNVNADWDATSGDSRILNKPDFDGLSTTVAGKQNEILGTGNASDYYGGDKSFHTLDKSAVGLSNVDNTSDADKPVSSAVLAALQSEETSRQNEDASLRQEIVDGDAATLSSANSYADSLVVGLLDDRGGYDPTLTQTYPSSNGSGPSGSILRGDVYTFIADGTIGSINVNQGDVLRALVDNPSQATDWLIIEHNLGYNPEPAITPTTAADYYAGDKTFKPLTKEAVGLSEVDNTSDLNKPVSTAQATAIADAKTWQRNSDGVTVYRDSAVGINTADRPLTATLDIDMPLGVVSGLAINDVPSTGYFKFANATGSGTNFAPYLQSRSIGSNRPLAIYNDILPADDTGTTPIIQLASRVNAGLVTTRPLLSIGNHTTRHFVMLATGNTGFGTAVPSTKLEVAGVTTTKDIAYKPNAYTVAPGAQVVITLPDGTTTLTTGKYYRIRLSNNAGSVASGNSYIVYHTSATTWVVKPINITGIVTTHPLLLETGGTLVVYHNNTANVTINVFIESFATGNITTISKDFLGNEGLLTGYLGNAGFGTDTPTAKVQIKGNLKLDGTTSGSTTLIAPATGSDLSYTLPGTAPTTGQVLSSTAAGTMSWVAAGLEFLTDTGSSISYQTLYPKTPHPNTTAGGGILGLYGYAARSGQSSSFYGFTLNHKAGATVGSGSLDLQTTRNITSPDYNVSGQFSVGLGKGLKVAGNNNIVVGSFKNEFVQTVSGANNLYFLTQENFSATSGTSTGSNNIAISTQSPTLINGSGNIVLGGLPVTVDGSNNTIIGANNSYQPTSTNNIFIGSGGGSFARSGQLLISPHTLGGVDLDLGIDSLRVGNYSSAGDLSGTPRRMNRKELNYLLVQTNPVAGTSYSSSSNLLAAASTNTMPMRNSVVEGCIRTTVVNTGDVMQKRAVYKFEGTYYNGSLNYTLTQLDTAAGGDTSGLIPVTLSIVSNTLRVSVVNNDPTTTGTGFTLRLAAYVCAQDLNPDITNL